MNTKAIVKKLKNISFKILFPVVTLLALCSHDLYLKMETYFLKPNQEATINLYNGTFEKSENVITRDRMLDASLVANGERVPIDSTQWKDKDSTVTQLDFRTGKPGTYVVGVSTKPRNIELTADKFNAYLEHDGVLDMLEYRAANNALEQDAVESYQKHVKAIYQVGDSYSNDWNQNLGYPIEFIPLANPYEKYSGDKIELQLLLDGKPLTNQLVYADYLKTTGAHTHGSVKHEHGHGEGGHSHSNGHGKDSKHEHAHKENSHSHQHQEAVGSGHEHEHSGKSHTHQHSHKEDTHEHKHDQQEENTHSHTSGQQLRTNAQGIVAIDLPEDGIYYIRTIHMENVTDSDELTHQSKWATLTFEVSHKHDASTHTHHEHEHEEGIPTWVFVLVSVLVIGVLFFAFRKKN